MSEYALYGNHSENGQRTIVQPNQSFSYTHWKFIQVSVKITVQILLAAKGVLPKDFKPVLFLILFKRILSRKYFQQYVLWENCAYSY